MSRCTRARVTVSGALFLLGACRPVYYYDYYEETDVILTVPEPDRDFAPLVTYGLWDEVIDLSDLTKDPIEIDHDRIDPQLLNAVEQNMDALGFEQVDPKTGDPDVVAIIGVVAQDNWYLYSYYYWYDYWYWYYPGYYPVYAVSYPSGSAIITLVKPDEATIDDKGLAHAPVIWVAGVWGALSDSSTNNIERVVDGIDQAFDQSPYLAR